MLWNLREFLKNRVVNNTLKCRRDYQKEQDYKMATRFDSCVISII